MLAVPKDSRMTLEWVTKACTQNPPAKIFDDKGAFTGNYMTGPVRLSWTKWLHEKQKNEESGRETYSVVPLFPPGADLSVLNMAVTEAAAAAFPQNMTAQGFVWHGIGSPFHDQAEKTLKYEGYTPGAIYFNTSTEFPPSIVDPNMNPIVDKTRVYPGVWGMLAVNCYAYGDRPKPGRPAFKKGVSFGLQSVVIIGDDQNIGGGGAIDPRKAFAGIKLDHAVNVAAGFGVPTAPIAGAPAGPMSIEDMRRMGLVA